MPPFFQSSRLESSVEFLILFFVFLSTTYPLPWSSYRPFLVIFQYLVGFLHSLLNILFVCFYAYVFPCWSVNFVIRDSIYLTQHCISNSLYNAWHLVVLNEYLLNEWMNEWNLVDYFPRMFPVLPFLWFASPTTSVQLLLLMAAIFCNSILSGLCSFSISWAIAAMDNY